MNSQASKYPPLASRIGMTGKPRHLKSWFSKAAKSDATFFLSDYRNNSVATFDVKTKAQTG
ncbi:MAG TPA: hypothetical protein VGF18_10505, partial [Candidatus Tumulicola sp.]